MLNLQMNIDTNYIPQIKNKKRVFYHGFNQIKQQLYTTLKMNGLEKVDFRMVSSVSI